MKSAFSIPPPSRIDLEFFKDSRLSLIPICIPAAHAWTAMVNSNTPIILAEPINICLGSAEFPNRSPGPDNLPIPGVLLPDIGQKYDPPKPL